MKTLPLYKQLNDSWLPEIGILWLFFLSRLWNNLALPAYIDEGNMILRARFIERGQYVFDPLFRRGKWLQPAGMSLFSPDGPETLWLARIASVLLVMFSCAACIALGRMLASRTTGRLAGLFYILPALGFINERSAVSDVWMAAFSALALALAVRLALKRKSRDILPLGLAMAAAILSKVSGIPLLAVPLAAALILPGDRSARKRALIQGIAAVAVATIIVGVLLAVAQKYKPPDFAARENGAFPVASVCKHSPLCDAATDGNGFGFLTSEILGNFRQMQTYAIWFWFLIGPPMLLLTAGSLAWVRGHTGRGIAFLWVVLLGRAALIIGVGNWLPIRNFLIQVPPLAVLSALTVSALWQHPSRTSSTKSLAQPPFSVGYRATVTLVALATMFWSVPVDFAFAQHPETVRVPPQDPFECRNREHYSFANGYGEVQTILLEWVEANGPPNKVHVVSERVRHMVPYWGPRLGESEQWKANSDEMRVRLAQWLIAGDTIFFVDELPTRPIPDEPYGASMETIAAVSLPPSCGDVSLRVRRLVADGPELRNSIYEIIFPNPNESEEQYRAIAQYFIDSQTGGAVLVYPPNQFELLNSRLQWGTALDGVFVIGDTWPLDTQQVEDSLEEMAAEHDMLHVVLLAEELGDPTQAIESWLDANMELASDMSFGPVRLLTYH